MLAHMEHCWKHYRTHPWCQPVFPISACLLKYKDIVDTWKWFNP